MQGRLNKLHVRLDPFLKKEYKFESVVLSLPAVACVQTINHMNLYCTSFDLLCSRVLVPQVEVDLT